MFRIIFIGGLLVTLTLFGCQQSEQTQPAQTPSDQAPSAPQQSAPEEKAPEAIVTTTDESKEGMVETEARTVDAVIEKAVEETGETAVAAKETAQDDAAVLRDQTAADKDVATATSTDSLEDVIFKGNFGTVTMSHQMHADAFSCAQCHGEGSPGTIELGREAAHDLCIGCHQEQNAGPTTCAACHIR